VHYKQPALKLYWLMSNRPGMHEAKKTGVQDSLWIQKLQRLADTGKKNSSAENTAELLLLT